MPDEIGTPAEGAAADTTPALDTSPIADRVNELAGNFENFSSRFDQFVQAQQPQPEPEPDLWDNYFNPQQEEVDQYGQPVQQPNLDPQALAGAFDQRLQQAIQQATGPLHQQLQQYQLERAGERLGQLIPDLADKPENAEARQRAHQLVAQSLQTYPPQIAQILQNDPNYIATQWKAAEADRLGQAQVPASQQVTTLEGAGGAHPGGDGQPVNPVHQAMRGHTNPLASGFR